jgi:hypothetical protein
MSRYVQVAVESATLAEVSDALRRLGLSVNVGLDDPVLLPPSLECAGELVDVACPAGSMGAVEAFGFRLGPAGDAQQTSSLQASSLQASARLPIQPNELAAVTLVCGDVDRRRLERELVPKLRFEVAAARVTAEAATRGLAVERVEAGDNPRLVVRTHPRRKV